MDDWLRSAPKSTKCKGAFGRLKARAEFLSVAKGGRYHTTTLTLQAVQRSDPSVDLARFGLTVTKKVGGAVERNRIRRRLREALRLSPDLAARENFDYVVLARREALTAPFGVLIGDLGHALRRIHDPRRTSKRKPAGDVSLRRSEAAGFTIESEGLTLVSPLPSLGSGKTDTGGCDQDR